MTHISDLLPEPWPEEITGALARWRQGDLIEKPPLFWSADPRHPLLPFTETNGDPSRDWQIFSLSQADRPQYGAIASQTCDICEVRPFSPFVDVAPVIDLEDVLGPGPKVEIRRHLWNSYIFLTRQPMEGRFYVADLRAIFPVEKGALVARDPLPGFATERDRLDFSDRIATRFARPAYADSVHEHVIGSLDRWIRDGLKDARKQRSARFSGVQEVRLRIDGDRLDPRAVQLVVFQKTPLSQEDQAAWRGWRADAAALIKDSGIELLPIHFSSKSEMSAADYDELSRVPLRYVGREN